MKAENSASEGNMRQPCDATGKPAGKYSKPERSVKNKEGKPITEIQEQSNRRKIWEEEQVPTDWNEGHLIKIPKKGDLSKCENYRSIILLSAPGKISNSVLLNRMKDSTDAQLRDQQIGFRKDRSCTN
ncbi:unnamed protein product [Schistosoma curassoni]|uniref:Reverse transcriptase domain-containing protein n=1 Tax=Schistosoma curassoni TaxID=6186 RepID=A0A183KTM6_9TREM|nr:unnamed protein product [Schistosoma curassoni]